MDLFFPREQDDLGMAAHSPLLIMRCFVLTGNERLQLRCIEKYVLLCGRIWRSPSSLDTGSKKNWRSSPETPVI
jgi:hypothetical protein